MFNIYKVTNLINGQVYIGFTKNPLSIRKYQHVYDAKKSLENSTRPKFYNAINKYGADNFTWEIIYQSWDKRHCKDVMEDYFIDLYDSYKKGYNTVRGGSAGNGLPRERNGMYGKNHTDEVKRSLSEQAKARNSIGENNPMFGKKRSDVSERNKQPKRWITDGNRDSQILRFEPIPDGWTTGRSSQKGERKIRPICKACEKPVNRPKQKFCCSTCANKYNGSLR